MKKTALLILFLLLLLACFAACDRQEPPTPPEQSAPEQTTDPATDPVTELVTEPIDPALAPAPEQVIGDLDEAAVIMEIGTKTRQVLLHQCDWEQVQTAFVKAGYADVDAVLLQNTKLKTRVMHGNQYTLTLQQTADGVHAIWEPYNQAVLSVLTPNQATDTGEVTLAQLGIAREEETDNPMNGMCYIYKLSDGSAVIIDGGFNTEDCRNNIINTLAKLDIAKTEEGRYRITAWILTHGHKDHRAAFTGVGNKFGEQIALSYVLYNFPVSPGTLTASTFDLVNFEDKLATNYPDAVHVVAHAGLVYHFGNLSVQMLYSPELMYKPGNTISYYNDTSLIFVAGCSGSSTLYMGDAGENAAAIAWNTHERAAFKATMLQLTHHGFNTGDASHTWKFIRSIYNSTDAAYGLVPMGSRYVVAERNGRYTVIVGHGVAGYQMSFVIDKTDRHGQNSISQEYYDQFVADVAAGTNTYPTLYGYDGVNKIVSNKGLITYTSGNESEPMITLFSLSEGGVSVKDNRVLSEWLG